MPERHSSPKKDQYQFPFVLLTIINVFFSFRERRPGFVCFLVRVGRTALGKSAFFFRFPLASRGVDKDLQPPRRPGPAPYVSAPPLTPSAARAAAVCSLPSFSAGCLLQAPARLLATWTEFGRTVLTWFQHRRKLGLPASLLAYVSELRSHGDPGVGRWVGPAGPAIWGRCVDCRRSG